jgi:hypothetical protein
MRALGLVFGTVGMKITSDDEYVFFGSPRDLWVKRRPEGRLSARA